MQNKQSELCGQVLEKLHGAGILRHLVLVGSWCLVPYRDYFKSNDELWDLPQLGMNAQPLRFMDVALMLPIQLSLGGVPITVPHPAAFALHKLLIVPRRNNAEKKLKDLDSAVLVLELLEKKNEIYIAHDLLAKFPNSWKKTILTTLRSAQHNRLADLLTIG